MSNCTSTLYGSVPFSIGEEEFISLTGSSTLTQLGGYNILTDLGLFQGTEGSDYFNKKNIEFLLENEIDCAIITHPHIDHVGRLPLLYKYGFRKPIYMTKAGKDITKHMLYDSLKIQEGERLERLRINNKLGFRLRQALKIKNYLHTLKQNKFSSKEEKEKIDYFLIDVLGENYNTKEVLEKINKYLDLYKIKTENDIKNVIKDLNELLFEQEDIEGVLSLIQTVDYTEEQIISNKKIKGTNKNLENQDKLENLPEEIANGFEGNISVDYKSDKRKFRQIWNQKYKENIKRVKKENPDIEDKKENLKKDLEIAVTFVEQYDFLNNLDQTKLNLYKRDENFKQIISQYENSIKLLSKFGIINREDINRILENDEIIIDLFKIGIPFSKDDIKKAGIRLQIENNGNSLRQVIGSVFTNAQHVVGSASVFLTIGETKSKVNNIFNANGNAFSVFLSGDLGRFTNENRLGKPELPPHPVDFLQIETTYGGREHRNKEESVKELIDSIESGKSNVLISCFAQQRLQEILMTILEEKQKNKNLFNDREIVIDAPLGEKLNYLYIEHQGETFDLLDEDVQEKIFGKVMFRYLEEGESNEIYKYKDGPKQYVILSSSGMMDGGAIMNHLPHIGRDTQAKILAPGYLCEGTIGHQIVTEGRANVTINGVVCPIECESKFVNGFSSHISHNEILSYLTESIKLGKLKLDSTIALNHGNIEGQKKLKNDIENILKQFDRSDIKVVIPELFEEYDIKNRVSKENKKEQNIKTITTQLKRDRVITPSFLLADKKLEKYEEPKSQEEIELKEKQSETKGVINKFQKECLILFGRIRKMKEKFSKEFLQSSLNPYIDNLFFRKLSQIKNLSQRQGKEFNDIIDKKLENRKNIKSSVSSLKGKTKNIDIIFELIEEFKNQIDNEYPIEIEEIEEKIKIIEEEIEQLDSENNETTEEEQKLMNQNISSKKRKLHNLLNKLINIKFLLTGDATELKKKIENLNSGVKTIENNIRTILNKKEDEKESKEDRKKNKKKDSEKVKELGYKKLEKKRKIRQLESKISKIESKRPNFENRLKRNIPEKLHQKLDKIFKRLWYTDNDEAILELRELCDSAVSDINSDIIVLKGDLKPHISIELEEKEPYFGGKDLFTELKQNNTNSIDFDKLEELLDTDILSQKDKEYIETILNRIDTLDLDSKNGKQAFKNLSKKISMFFKKRQRFNEDLGIDFSVSIKEMNEHILETLSNIFEKDYFEDNILPYFDIYLFLKSKESINEYITRKYNLERLKWFDESFSQFDDLRDDIKDEERNLQSILISSEDAGSQDDIENLDFGINWSIDIIKEVNRKVNDIV